MRNQTVSRRAFGVIGRLIIGVVAITAASVPGGALRAQIAAARFGISIDGVQIAVFSRFDSLVDPSATGGSQAISLTGGKSDSPLLAAWHEAVLMGDIVAARKSCTLIMYNSAGAPVARWNFQNAWPVKYTGAAGQALRTEGIVLVYESMTVDR